jgi:hypothetical protein
MGDFCHHDHRPTRLDSQGVEVRESVVEGVVVAIYHFLLRFCRLLARFVFQGRDCLRVLRWGHAHLFAFCLYPRLLENPEPEPPGGLHRGISLGRGVCYPPYRHLFQTRGPPLLVAG